MYRDTAENLLQCNNNEEIHNPQIRSRRREDGEEAAGELGETSFGAPMGKLANLEYGSTAVTEVKLGENSLFLIHCLLICSFSVKFLFLNG
ncbi:unnamed protein product [Oikopleura dioica]|uniref:Uncharacterized protein n=1 Tax=Oikopleura dioica TaxID=34765 RepID=E4XZX2_OIKDI|nr:unnamed protein product [Oikopleura dioica]